MFSITWMFDSLDLKPIETLCMETGALNLDVTWALYQLVSE